MIHWSAAARKHVRLGRLGEAPRSARKPGDERVARVAVTDAFRSAAEHWAAGEERADAACRASMRAVAESFASADWRIDDVEIEGARAALVTAYERSSRDAVSDHLVPLWVASKGAPFALASLLEAASFRREWHPRPGKEPGWLLVRAKPDHGPKRGPIVGWGALRDELGRVPSSDYRRALADAEAVRAAAPLALRCALGYAFPTESGWSKADAEACFALKEFPGFGVTLLAASDLAIAARVAAVCPGWAHAEEHVFTSLDVHGDAATEVLDVLLARAPDAKVARALALIETLGAASALTRCLKNSKLKKIAETYFSSYPRLAPSRPVATARAASPAEVGVRTAWRRIDAWLAGHHPDGEDVLASGANDDALERCLGFGIPEMLRASLLAHDGESSDAVGILRSFVLHSSAEILADWRSMLELEAGLSDDENTPLDAIEGVKFKHWHRGWLPIAADGTGNSLCVDLDPGPGGTPGQIILRDHEVGPTEVLAPDLRSLLERIAAEMEAGKIHVSSDGGLRDERDEL